MTKAETIAMLESKAYLKTINAIVLQSDGATFDVNADLLKNGEIETKTFSFKCYKAEYREATQQDIDENVKGLTIQSFGDFVVQTNVDDEECYWIAGKTPPETLETEAVQTFKEKVVAALNTWKEESAENVAWEITELNEEGCVAYVSLITNGNDPLTITKKVAIEKTGNIVLHLIADEPVVA